MTTPKRNHPHRTISARTLALDVLTAVIHGKRSLTDALNTQLAVARPENAFAKQLCFGTLRFYDRLQWQLQQLLTKPLKADQQTVELVLLLGLYQVQFSHIPTHAAVSETVELLRDIRQEWAVGLVNAILRNFLRQQSRLEESLQKIDSARYSHPTWLIRQVKSAWPQAWSDILTAGLSQAPLTVRVNRRCMTRDSYLSQLKAAGIEAEATRFSPVGVRLAKGMMVEQLPGFIEGKVSVQDEAAQLAALLLDVEAGHRVLDACAAPGGKSGHLLETADIELTALDVEMSRCRLIQDNLLRLGLRADIVKADASDLNKWWDRRAFDRILLDAPCSATGIIRRQPDIKLHRQPADLKALAATQTKLLKTLWSALKPGGILVYATCSILPIENQDVIRAFLQAEPDALLQPMTIDGLAQAQDQVGVAIAPGFAAMDGFFYAKLQKRLP